MRVNNYKLSLIMGGGYRLVKIRKLWHGFASVRSYIVDEVKTKKQALVIIFKNEKMTIPYYKLSEGMKNDFKIKSKQKLGQTYDLIDFDWKPDKIHYQLTLL